jgi:ribosomal-protein-alanine N-acetyltransferase
MSELKWPKRIETNRLILRELKETDIEFVFHHFSNEDVCRYLYDEEPLTRHVEAMEIIRWYSDFELIDHCRWGIELKKTGTLIGTCGFHCLDGKNKIVEIGYDLNKDYWRHGYMTEALNQALGVAFNNMNINRIQAFVYTGNEGSYKLLESLGFMREGTVRDKHFYNGQYYDHFCYSLLANERK